MSLSSMIRAVLFDIDGTLVAGGRALPGAAEAVACCRREGLFVRFLTNITSRRPHLIAADLQDQGVYVEGDEIQTAISACVEYLESRAGITCHLIVPTSIRPTTMVPNWTVAALSLDWKPPRANRLSSPASPPSYFSKGHWSMSGAAPTRRW